MSTKEVGQKVVFLRKLVAGGSNHSFGIHVARMAGMPQSIVERANEILKTLESKWVESEDASTSNHTSHQKTATQKQMRNKVKNIAAPLQLHIFDVDDYTLNIKETLLGMDLDTMTPIDALWKLNELVKIAKKSS